MQSSSRIIPSVSLDKNQSIARGIVVYDPLLFLFILKKTLHSQSSLLNSSNVFAHKFASLGVLSLGASAATYSRGAFTDLRALTMALVSSGRLNTVINTGLSV